MKSAIKTGLVLLSQLMMLGPLNVSAQVVINEFSASNLSQFPDNYGNYEDWIELYNTSVSTINIGGYYLSDDSVQNTKWVIPAGTTIAANGFLRFWTSGRNEFSGTDFHTSFKLTQTKNNKEYVVFSGPGGNIVDCHKLSPTTQLGHSAGRSPNGSATWSVFINPTPNASNNTATAYMGYAKKPQVSTTAGFYSSAITVSLTTTEPNSSIRYTLDGTLPNPSSTLYTGPINITSTKVLKARTFSNNPSVLSSFVEFNTYFINVQHSLPVVSVSGNDLQNLANGDGSLVPLGSFEYFDSAGIRQAKTYGEFNKHGQDSWANSQRSLDFVSRDEMGYNHSVEEKLFSRSNRANFQRLILRAAGDDNYPADHNPSNAGSAHLRDAYVHSLADLGGLNLDVRRFAKCVIYLNGQYWGVYDLRERPDDHDYTDYYYGQDKYHLQYLLLWGGTWAEYGGTQALNDWAAFYSYIMSIDMSVPANFQYVEERLDVKSLVDYVLVNMFSVCSDWLNWNTGWWRGLDPTGGHLKWGYILWDNDATFGHYINYTGIPNTTPNAQPCDPEGLSGGSDPEGHIQLLLHLRQNPEFNNYYINRQIDLWNSVFGCNNMLHELDSVVAIIDPEMEMHANRWGGTYPEWQANVQQLRDFINERCTVIDSGFIDCYTLTGPYSLTLENAIQGSGRIGINSLVIDSLPWSASYFGNIDIKVRPLPAPGYIFDHWSMLHHTMLPSATNDTAKFQLTHSDTLTAHYLFTSSDTKHHDPSFLEVFPTCFSNEFCVRFGMKTSSVVNLWLCNISGVPVMEILRGYKTIENTPYSINVDAARHNLAPGMYLLVFESESINKTVKLICQP